MIRDFNFRPVHHEGILGMSCVTQWKVHKRPQQGATEAGAPGVYARVHPSVLRTVLISPKVRGVESAPREKEEDVIPKQHGIVD